ncbi:CUB and sushi domain-containing protein 1-like [Branchiostoma floridae]|uniref:CUB and sushi domain-containing protein 1-like n=1 Tax=Branchiostoma floridae TaxID=7739 RepID=A0A9J7N6E8_BRAFL|nr:CUB and sushi domain-containing protein 1-like [Branchiostoma floridae]
MKSAEALLRFGTLLLGGTLILTHLPTHAQEDVTLTSGNRCGGSFTAPSGGPMTSPNYPSNYGNNEICEWLITVPAENRILLTFHSNVYLEKGNDFLVIYDGGSDKAAELWRMTGIAFNDYVLSTSNTVFLRFTSDGELTRKGFHFSYTSQTIDDTVQDECGDYISGQSSGKILSPNFPGEYDSDLRCTWTIVVSPGNLIRLEPEVFNIPLERDYLKVYDGQSEINGTIIGIYDGQVIPQRIISASNIMQLVFLTFRTNTDGRVGFKIRFEGRDIPQEILVTSNLIHLVLITDNSATEGGFKIHYKAFFLLRPPCFNPGVPENGLREGNSFDVGEFVSFRCDDGFTLKGRAILSCMSGYQMGWDGPLPTCKAECGGYRTTHAPGFIYSPNYPGQYGNNMNCTWTIEANLRQGEGIGMKIEKFSLEEGHDRLLIYDGDPISDSTLFGEYSGQEIPREVNSTSHIIHLVLITDESGSEDGFTINYEGFPLTDDSGCPDFRSIENGSIGKFEDGWILKFEDKRFPLGSTIPFRCDKWNYLRGPSEITCMPGGIWSSRPPTCEDATWCHGQRIVDEEEGEIKSPRVDLGRGLYNYPNNVDCRVDLDDTKYYRSVLAG